ncbi:MAG TPA: sorbosone dehydrogenase family protein, partial [Thermoanaerobaculia bacterium]|nr:sorbosone dehydrogenase family protein [Thermoanaerobaculia bacterium]
MSKKELALMVVLGFGATASWCGAARDPASLPIASLRLPPGFSISHFAAVPGARSMALGEKGTLFVGTRDTRGSVFAVAGAGVLRPGRVVKIASGLEMPNGVAFRDGALYVAEVSRILRFDAIESKLDA